MFEDSIIKRVVSCCVFLMYLMNYSRILRQDYKMVINAKFIQFQNLRTCKKRNLTICRKDRDLILGPTARSIPVGMRRVGDTKSIHENQENVKAISEQLLNA